MSTDFAPQSGDMDKADFRRHAHRLVDWIAEYLDDSERYPVLSTVQPRDIVNALPSSAPRHGESFDAVLDDFERILVPGLTHWNHPGFFAYFSISASAPGVLAEFLAAALNQQAMLWRTSPTATELEEVSLGWLRDLMGLSPDFEGVIYDTASISSMHALAAAREAAVPHVRERGLSGATAPNGVAVYCSEHAHSSIDKAVITLGLGHASLRKVSANERFEMRVDALQEAIAADRRAGIIPIAVVATVGTTSTTSVDPVREIAALCARERVWLHVDAAYGGAAALLSERRHFFDGCEQADSLVVNPHKWLFTPVDLSAFFCRRMDVGTRSVFADAGVPSDARRGHGEESDGYRHTAWPAVPRVEALDHHAVLRRRRVEGETPRTHRACDRVCDVGRRAPGLRTAGACAVQRRLLSSPAVHGFVDGRRARPPE